MKELKISEIEKCDRHEGRLCLVIDTKPDEAIRRVCCPKGKEDYYRELLDCEMSTAKGGICNGKGKTPITISGKNGNEYGYEICRLCGGQGEMRMMRTLTKGNAKDV